MQVLSSWQEGRPRVAILIDGDNLSPDLAGRIITRSKNLGVQTIRRVYGCAKSLPRWDAAPGFRFVHAGSGKNAADVLLSLDALEIALEGRAEAFVIASSDRDFAHIALRLRERGFMVVGMGEAKAPDGFRKACSTFEELSLPARPEPGAGVPTPAPRAESALDARIRELIREAGGENGLPITTLNECMHKKHGVRIGEHPAGTWRAYLAQRPALYDCDPKGPSARVRLRGSPPCRTSSPAP